MIDKAFVSGKLMVGPGCSGCITTAHGSVTLCLSSRKGSCCMATVRHQAMLPYQSKRACEKLGVVFSLLQIHVLILVDFRIKESAEWGLELLQTVVHCKETQDELPVLFLAKTGCTIGQQAQMCDCQLVQ